MTKFYTAPASPNAADYCRRVDEEFDRQLTVLGITNEDGPKLINHWQNTPQGSQIMTIRADGKSVCRFVSFTRPTGGSDASD